MGVPVSALQDGYTHLSGAASALSGESADLAVGLAATGAAIAVVGAVAVEKGVSGFLEMADSVRELTERTGASIATVQGFQYALGTVGESSDSADRALTIFSRNAGTLSDELEAGKAPAGHFADSLEKLGISAQAFVSASPDERIRMVADGFAKLSDDAPKAQIAMELFGRQGASLISVLSQGSAAIDEGTAKTAQFGATMTVEGEQKALAFHKSMADLNLVVTGFENEIGSALVPKLTSAAAWLATAAKNARDFENALENSALARFLQTIGEGAKAFDAQANAIEQSIPGVKQLNEAQIGSQVSADNAAKAHRDASPAVRGLASDYAFLDDNTTKAAESQKKETDAVAAAGKVTLDFSGFLTQANQTSDLFGTSIARNTAVQNELQGSTAAVTARMNDMAAAAGLTATGAGAAAAATGTLTSAATAAGKSAADAATFQTQFKQAIDFTGLSADDQTNKLAALDEIIKSGDERQKASAQSQKSLDEAVRATGASAAEHAVHVQAMNDAWQTASGNEGSVTAMFDEIQREAGDSSTKVQDLQSHILDLFSKPTQEELNLKAQIADVNSQMADFQSTLSNSNPALQHVAAMQKVYDNAVLTGQSMTAQNKAKADLDRALADTGPAGAAIAKGQEHYDKLALQKKGLDDNLQSLQAHDGALSANALALQGNTRTVGETDSAYGLFTRTVTTGSTDQHNAIVPLTADYHNLAGGVEHVTTAGGLLVSQFASVGGALRSALNAAGLTGAVTAAGYQGGGGGGFVMPAQGTITQPYGPTNETAEPIINGQHFHQGLDIGVQPGTGLRAAGAGVVSSVLDQGQQHLGLSVTIDLGNGLTETLGHLDQALVAQGQTVTAGQVVGLSGGELGSPTSGASTGPHTHVQVTQNGQIIDPMTLFSGGANAASAGAAAATAAVNSVFGGPLPDSWYKAIQANESTLPLPGANGPQPMFGITASPYAVGTGTFSSGGTPEASASLGVGAGQTRQALFPSTQAGAQAFNAIWQKNPGAVAAAQAGDFPAFLQALVAGGYAGPGEGGQWPSQVLSHYQPGAGAPGAAPSASGLSDLGQIPSPAPETATGETPEQLRSDAASAQDAINALGRTAATVTTGIHQQITSVTQEQLSAAASLQQSAAATANTQIDQASRAEQAVQDDIDHGATPEKLKADKEVAASAVKAANDSVAAFHTADQSYQQLASAYAQHWNDGYEAQTAGMQANLQQQSAMQQTSAQRLELLGATEVVEHRAVNAATLADDTTTINTRQQKALQSNSFLLGAQQQVANDLTAITDAKQRRADDIEMRGLNDQLARDQVVVSSAKTTADADAGAFHIATQQKSTDVATLAQQENDTTAKSVATAENAARVKVNSIQGVTAAQRTALDEQIGIDFQGADSGVREYRRLTDELATYGRTKAGLVAQLGELVNQRASDETIAIVQGELTTVDAYIEGETTKRDEIKRTLGDAITGATAAADATIAQFDRMQSAAKASAGPSLSPGGGTAPSGLGSLVGTGRPGELLFDSGGTFLRIIPQDVGMLNPSALGGNSIGPILGRTDAPGGLSFGGVSGGPQGYYDTQGAAYGGSDSALISALVQSGFQGDIKSELQRLNQAQAQLAQENAKATTALQQIVANTKAASSQPTVLNLNAGSKTLAQAILPAINQLQGQQLDLQLVGVR